MAIRLDTPQNGFAIDWLGQRIRLPIRTSDTGGLISAQSATLPPASSTRRMFTHVKTKSST